MKTRLWLPVTVVIFLLLLAYALFQVSNSRTFQFFGTLTARVETDQKVVALTFDDGPTDKTPEVLDIMDALGVKASFFLIGAALEEHPVVGERIAASGHEIGNHTYSHQRMYFKLPGFIQSEIERTDELIRRTGYQGQIHFRPPYSKKLFLLPLYLMQHNRRTIMVDVEAETFARTGDSKEEMVERVLRNTRPGSIILLHPHSANDEPRKALPEIVRKLQDRGFRFVTVSELLAYQ